MIYKIWYTIFGTIQYLGILHNHVHNHQQSLHNCIEYSGRYAVFIRIFSGYFSGSEAARSAPDRPENITGGRGYPRRPLGGRIVPGTPGETETYYIYTSPPRWQKGVGMAVTSAISKKIAGDKIQLALLGFFMDGTSLKHLLFVSIARACPFPRISRAISPSGGERERW